MKNKKKYETTPEIRGVDTQPALILPSIPKFIFLPPFAITIPITAPTTACELDTGTSGKEGRLIDSKNIFRSFEANTNSTIELAITTPSASIGDNLKILFPTVDITLFEYVKTPIEIATEPIKKAVVYQLLRRDHKNQDL